MSAGESLMPTTQTEDVKAELGIDAQFSRDADNVAVTTAPIIVGLTKEELEHYRNDPKYKFLRWALFILFWLTWLGLFAAAILLIIMSPGGKNVNDGKVWTSTASVYEIFVPTFRDTDNDMHGDFKGVQEKLGYLKNLHVDTLLLTSVFESVKDYIEPGQVSSYEKIGDRVGGEGQLKDLVKEAASNDMKIVVDVPLTVARESGYYREPYVRNGTLDISKDGARNVLLQSVKKLKDLGVNGVYIHGNDFKDSSVDDYNQLINEIHEQANDEDFGVFVGCQGSPACLDLNASVIVIDPHDASPRTFSSLIDAHLKYANRTVINNTSVTFLGNSVYHPRANLSFADPEDRFRFVTLLNALRLFVYPTAHSLYGDEYGLEDNADVGKHLGAMYWEDSKRLFHDQLKGFVNPGVSYSSEHVQNRFKGLGHLRHKLRSANLVYLSDKSVVRLSEDKVHYILAFNKGATTADFPYTSLVPVDLVDELQHASFVNEDGTDAVKIENASGEKLRLKPYEYKIIKIEA